MNEKMEREYTLVRRSEADESISELLADGETVFATFALVRDHAYFTDRRIIISDIQGVVGKKKEFLSVPYRSIQFWSVESAGVADVTSEMDIYLRDLKIIFNLRRDVNVNELSKIIAEAVL